MADKRILIVVDGFPQISETFIVNHIVSLKKLGFKTHIMANRMIKGPYHAMVEDYKLINETTFRSRIPLNRFKRIFVFLKYLIKIFVLNPGAAVHSLNKTMYGKSAWNGELAISLYSYLRIEKPNFIHCHFGVNGVITEKIMSILKWEMPLFVSFHGYDTVLHNLTHTCYDRLFRNAATIFTNSKYLKTKVIEIGCDKDKINIIPVGLLEYPFIRVSEQKKEGFRFISIGRLVEFKGIEYTLKAFKLFIDETPDAAFQYIVIGDGECNQKLRNLSEALAIDRYVRFTGSLTSNLVSEYLSKASVFVLTGITTDEGRAETQGLVYQEAARYGLPLIASDAGGVSEYVSDGTTGLIAKEKDVIDIKEKIKMLYFDAELRERLGKAAEVYAKANFDQMKLTQKMIEIYEHYQKN